MKKVIIIIIVAIILAACGDRKNGCGSYSGWESSHSFSK